MARVEDLAPDTIGTQLIRVRVADPDAPLRAHQPITVLFDFSAVDREGGVVLPLDVTVVSGSSSASYRRVTYRRVVPSTFTWTPVEGGPHLVRIGERYHNRWFGALRLDVSGARLDASTLG